MTATADGPPPVRRPLRTSAWALVLVLVVVGFGFVASRSQARPDPGPPRGDLAAARQAVDALLAPGPAPTALDRLPADFTEVTGVLPDRMPARDGTVRAVHVDGGCSAPWGDDNTRWDYSVPCKAHDLGYDLLRYAAAKGSPLGPDAREALDDRLSTDMHAACDLNPMDSAGTCRVVASAYSFGMLLNSWHQRWGPPIGEPIGPALAGLAVIGVLLVVRLRGWLRNRRTAAFATVPPGARPRAPASSAGRWALLGVAAIATMVLGESVVALARWAGASPGWLWPLTWLAQLSLVFFFAGGHANAAGWHAVRAVGGGYRQYLAHRAGRLLRPVLIFAVVAFAVPMALELLRIPGGTAAHVLRIALHPLWLLGVYLLTIVATPPLLAAHRIRPRLTMAALACVLVTAETLARAWTTPLPHYVSAVVLALLAQQAAFCHATYGRPRPVTTAIVAVAAMGCLAAIAITGSGPPVLLGLPGAPEPLAGPPLPVLLLGIVQLGVLGLLAGPLRRFAANATALRVTTTVLRAPMSLYLSFLAVMLLVVAVVYLPGRLDGGLDVLAEPRSLLALALLAAPAALVFRWFERHAGPPAPPSAEPVDAGLGALLGRSATVLGVGYATLGVFGFALSGFSDGTVPSPVPGISLDPIQSLVHLLLGVVLLHTVRIGSSGRASTWALTVLACAPSLLAATAGQQVDRLGLLVHGGTALFAVAALACTVVVRGRSRQALATEHGG
ncbi:phospholipase [Amycolatopsis antarctica]|uniref:Phospholipase n=1 Tax=Amycolatopsis antarctica TaxID=1854586 RepID=A0A263D8U4_9PSEU|nr:phospholipase [Amycolatopsis antarctica]OZM73896.1 phospholipase [Amycolatopsis antarctica]